MFCHDWVCDLAGVTLTNQKSSGPRLSRTVIIRVAQWNSGLYSEPLLLWFDVCEEAELRQRRGGTQILMLLSLFLRSGFVWFLNLSHGWPRFRWWRGLVFYWS
ncbi:hypothetical protein AAZX31_08G206600 [Glycine max]|nr:hypothetical protein GLYMA_08G209150v4 [Glycine max]KAH1052290.1 hypothetical protein GYH30_021904 [Glycine max]